MSIDLKKTDAEYILAARAGIAGGRAELDGMPDELELWDGLTRAANSAAQPPWVSEPTEAMIREGCWTAFGERLVGDPEGAALWNAIRKIYKAMIAAADEPVKESSGSDFLADLALETAQNLNKAMIADEPGEK